MTRERTVEATIIHHQIKTVTDKSQAIRQPGLSNSHHRPTLIKADNKTPQMPGQKTGAAGYIECASRRQTLHQVDDLGDFGLPSGTITVGEAALTGVPSGLMEEARALFDRDDIDVFSVQLLKRPTSALKDVVRL